MNEKDFFRIYIPALEEALLNDNTNYGFSVLTPDWYIKDDNIRRKIYLFEEENFDDYLDIFQSVALYFDSISHGFEKIDDLPIKDFKNKLLRIIKDYKGKFGVVN